MVSSTTKVMVLSPRPEKLNAAKRLDLVPRLKGLSGKAIFVVDNRRPNAQPLMDSIAQALSRDYAPRQVTRERKARSGVHIPDEMLERVVAEYDAVVEGLCS